ncbi:MAG: aspartate aminotransferase family protein, partial [Candidatus Nanopelagicales bacterium]|nr:aspartate aminotransferase family protein [Candidatus Nanopelagicales bacterium]
MTTIDRHKLSALFEQERVAHLARTPLSRAAYEGADHLFGRVPMTWMNKWSGGYPVSMASAHG